MKRPTSITVISWIFIVLGGVTLLGSVITFSTSFGRTILAASHVPLWFEIIGLFLTFGMYVVSGIVMLKGKNWGKYLYIILGGVNIIIGLFMAHAVVKKIEPIIVYGIFVFFLTRPIVNQFFKGEAVANEQEA